MTESIKQIYLNIETISSNYLNGFVGQAFNKNLLKSIDYNLSNTIRSHYPNLNIQLNLSYNEYDHILNSNIKINTAGFPLMSCNNYKSHNFIIFEDADLDQYNYKSYYGVVELKCQSCNILITESGTPIDGDYSCNEWLIKNIIE